MNSQLTADRPGPGVPNQGPLYNRVAISTFVIAGLAVVGRVGWRLYNRQSGLDDLMIVCAFLVVIVQTVFGLLDTHYGFGKHGADLTTEHLHRALMYFYLQQITYKFLGCFTKLSFLFLYVRIFPQKNFHILAWTVMGIVVGGSTAFGIATILQCTPIQRAWDKSIPGTCINFKTFWYTHSCFNAFFDILIYIMPMPLIKELQLKKGAKLGLVSVFALGGFVCAVSIVRMTFLAGSSKTPDNTWGSFKAVLWTEIESNTSIWCACMPALRAPMVKLFRRITGKPMDSSGRSYALEEMPSSKLKSSGSRNHYAFNGYNATIEKTGKRAASLSSSTERMVGIVKSMDVRISHSEVQHGSEV